MFFKSELRKRYEELRSKVSSKIAEREAILSGGSDIVIISTPEGEIRRVNKKTLEILGYTEKELYSLNYWSLIYPEDLKKTEAIVSSTKQTGARVLDFICRVRNKSGEYIPLKFHTETGSEGIFYSKAKLL